jgi:hypothetical protein
VDLKEGTLAGVLAGVAATLVLSGLREAWMRIGMVFETTPMNTVECIEEVGLLEGYSPEGEQAGCRSPASTERPGPSAHPRCCCPRWTTRCSGPRGGLRTGCSVDA